MQFLEPVVFQNIDKDVSPNGLDYSGLKIKNPLRDMLNGRYLSSENGETFQVESIRGTVEVPNAYLSAGVNECIGAYENVERNILMFHIWNSNGYHGVFKYDGTTEAITRLLLDDPGSPVLAFSNNPQYAITGAGMMGDIYIWTDNLNPQRYINITRSYGTINDFRISLIKLGPRNKPILGERDDPTFPAKTTNSTLPGNRLTGDSFQFAMQYVYLDDEESVLSPYSDLLTPDRIPNYFSHLNNEAIVRFNVDADLIQIIKSLNLLVRINNGPNWYIWKKKTVFGLSNYERFTNIEAFTPIPTETATKIFDSVPNRSKALTVFKNRVFLNINEEGFIPNPITLTPTLGAEVVYDEDTLLPGKDRAFLKRGGKYTVGIVFRDKFGRFEVINSTALLDVRQFFPPIAIQPPLGILPASNEALKGSRLDVSLSGTGSQGGQYFIVLSDEKYYSAYMQVPVGLAFYRRQEDTDRTGVEAIFNGRFYLNSTPNSRAEYSYLHLSLPKEAPFLPDTDCYVRLLNISAKIEKVVDVVDGNIMVTGDFDYDWSHSPSTITFETLLRAEVFKLRKENSVFFYEVAGPYTVNDEGTLLVPAITDIPGDAWIRENKWHFLQYSVKSHQIQSYVSSEGPPTKFGETPAPVFDNRSFDSIVKVKNDAIAGAVEQYISPDYTKKAYAKGRPFVEGVSTVLIKPATIRFSDPYIEGSHINGLNSFAFDNVYDKIGQDRSPITKIIPVGNILLAVHERQVTSVYVGEAILRTGASGALTSKIEGVIGDDRKLIGEVGSVHPESVQEIDGRAFGWDIFSGVVWRYTLEGIVPISKYGMEGYFRDKAAGYFLQRARLKFVGGIDKDNNEYLLTLPPLYETLDTVPVQASGPSTTILGAGMEAMITWEDLGHEWATIGSDKAISENGISGPPTLPSPWVKGDLVSVAGYTYNFSCSFHVEADDPDTDVVIEIGILDSVETILDSVSFNYTGNVPITSESFSITPVLAGTHVGFRVLNNTPIDTKTFFLHSFDFDTYVTVANATLTHDVVLDPLNYIVGQTYKLKVICYKQGATANDDIDVSIYNDGITPLFEHLEYTVDTAIAGDAFQLYIDFVYTGQSFLRVTVINIDFPIFVALTTEEQTFGGETWAFNYERNVWAHRYSFLPECMGRLNNVLLSFKNGKLYKHNESDTHNNYYGVQYERELTVAVNPQPNKVKTWSAIQIAAHNLAAVETGMKKVVEVSNDQGQESYTRVKEFDKKEGVYYGPILKDTNTNPALLNGTQIALRNGKDIRSKSLTVTIRNDRTDVSLLQKVNVVGEYSEFSA